MDTKTVLNYIEPELLKSNAVSYNDSVTRYFNDSQILTLKARLVERIFEIDKKKGFAAFVNGLMQNDISPEVIIERISEAFELLPDTDSGLKSLAAEVKELKLKIQNRFEIKDEMVYKFSYFDLLKIAIYGEDGFLISERPMHPHERQTDIFTLNSAVNE